MTKGKVDALEGRILRLEVTTLRIIGLVSGAAEKSGLTKDEILSSIMEFSLDIASELGCLRQTDEMS